MAGMSGSIEVCQPSPTCAERAPARWLALACRWLLAVVFLWAGLGKVTDLPAFRDRLLVHGSLPTALAWAVILVLPWLELVCAVCLIFGRAVREATALLSGLLVGFAVYGLTLPAGSDCGCSLFPGEPVLQSGWWVAGRSLVLLACCVPVLRRRG